MFALTVMMYHYVRDPGDAAEAGWGIPGMLMSEFEAQLDHLMREYAMIAWPEMCDYLVANEPLPERACLLTFDDGVSDHYLNVFPALRKRGLSGLFFALARDENSGLALGHKLHYLPARLGYEGLRAAVWDRLDPGQRTRYREAEARYQTRWTNSEVDVLKAILQRELSDEAEAITSELIQEHIGDEREIARRHYLSGEQVREMAAGGMHFGGHSRTHPWFDFIGSAQRAREVQASSEWLREVEPGPYAFAYPYGGLSEDAPSLLRAHNFAAAFTTREHVEQSDPFFIGRFDGEELVTAA